MSQYFVTQDGKTVGPWELEKIYSEIQQGNLQLNDYIFNPESQEWQVMLISPIIADSYRNFEIRKKPIISKGGGSFSDQNWENLEWFIFKENKQQGPFSYLEVIKLLQSKLLFDYDYVWSPVLPSWSKVFEIPAFSADQIKKLSQNHVPEIQAVFFRRQFPRIHFELPVFVHNSRKLWRTKTDELSAGGCSVTLSSSELEVGDRVIVHFSSSSSNELPAFNALCTIISKKPSGLNHHKLGIKFEALNQDIQLSLRVLTEKAVA